MTSQYLQSVTNQLNNLHGHAYFRVTDGPLKECLTGIILDAAEGDLAEQLSDGRFDLEVSVGVQEGDSEATVDFRVDRPGVIYRADTRVSALSEAALEDLTRYLAHLAQETPVVEEKAEGGVIVRKKVDHDHHEKEAAAARLKVTPQWLKSVIPCTEYSYDEIDGKKYIREYYWSRDLIERLFKIKTMKATPDDVQYVAKECCDGDVDWARDLIARLKSPNRPEQQKDQQQKGQPQKEKERDKEKGGAQQPQQAKPAGERSRRSRHRKSFRQGKDGARKEGQSPEARKPQAP
ncbi:hypothetical protein [Geomonas oryzae]|jgi:hypothetical protein|uniref:hypothetical protein n=1 Tax=Geomonas oryzae TaxID=2364273 RepID=UPI00100B483E|nr:hypothetical protein [Geomonas oryzae]